VLAVYGSLDGLFLRRDQEHYAPLRKPPLPFHLGRIGASRHREGDQAIRLARDLFGPDPSKLIRHSLRGIGPQAHGSEGWQVREKKRWQHETSPPPDSYIGV
jgi:hypothetical protein